MNKWTTFLLVICAITGLLVVSKKHAEDMMKDPISDPNKKKILIISSEGGGGHKTAARNIKSYVEGKPYSFVELDMLADVLQSQDPVQLLSFGNFNGNDLFNYLIKHKWYGSINMFYKIVKPFFAISNAAHVKAIDNIIQKHKPDLIISVVPIINGALYQAAKQADIPLLVIPTDLDLGIHFINGLHEPNWKKFRFTISFNLPLITNTLAAAKFSKENTPVVGFPVGKEFIHIKEKNRAALRTEFNIPEGKPVIMVMMGAQGSVELGHIAQQLTLLDIPAHVIFCIGRSENMRPLIEQISYPSQITRTVIGFTRRIADIMALSDVLYTKSGTLSVTEGLYARIPLLLDGTSRILLWEQINHDLVTQYGLGFSIKNTNKIAQNIGALLKNQKKLQTILKNLNAFSLPDPSVHIPQVIEELLNIK